MAILSIQSWVGYGHVGNAAAIFPLQRLGIEVWAVHTVQFSNHTGYGQWRGTVFPADDIAAILRGIGERGAFAGVDAILTGYLGSVALGEAALGAVVEIRAVNPAAIWLCDPVIGDLGRGVFVHPDIPAFFRDRALGLADIVTPNHFELEYLTGITVQTLDHALVAADALRAHGPGVVLVTSLRRDEAPADSVEMLAVDHAGAWLVTMPRLDFHPNGAGDVVAALFLGQYLKCHNSGIALSKAAASIQAILTATLNAGGGELALIAAQDEIVAPSIQIDAKRVR